MNLLIILFAGEMFYLAMFFISKKLKFLWKFKHHSAITQSLGKICLNVQIGEKFNLMSSNYSQELCLIVRQLLSSENDEFTINQLNLNLSQIQLKCGPRIQDSFQNIKIENLPPIIDGIDNQNAQLNMSLNPNQNNNNMPHQALNQSLQHQGTFLNSNDILHQPEQNLLFNNSPTNNYQNSSQHYIGNQPAGNFNQLSSLALNHQHTLSNPAELNMVGNLLQNNSHSPYNLSIANPNQTNPLFTSPVVNNAGLNNQNLFQQNGYYAAGSNNNIQPIQPAMNGNLQSFTNSGVFPQIQLNNNSLSAPNNQNQNSANMHNNLNFDQNALINLVLQMSQQLQQQQQLQESFYQSNNFSQVNYSPLRGANIFNQFNQKGNKYQDTQSENSKSYSALNGIPRRRTTIQYDDGSLYEGEMVLDYRDGFGRLVFSNKGVYEGTWKMNRMHGKGILYYPNGDVAYEGDWFEDQFNNFGHLYNSKAQHTKQKLDFKDFTLMKNYWLKYEGEFALDRKQGFGTIYYTNGERYSGNFKNDAVHGYGVFYMLDGDSFSGYWEENQLIKRM